MDLDVSGIDDYPGSSSLDPKPDEEYDNLLDRVALAVNSSLDIGVVLERLATLALEACPAHRCSVFLLDASKTKLVPRTYVAHPEVSDEIARVDYATRPHFRDMRPINLDTDPSRASVFRLGRAFTIPDLEKSPLVPPEVVKDYKARSAMVVPLIAPDEPLGVLALDWLTPKDDFGEEELVLVEAIGAYASLAIRNARLFERLDEKAHSLERLVEVAASLNSSLSLREVLDLACGSFTELLGSLHCSVNLLSETHEAPAHSGELDVDDSRQLPVADALRFVELMGESVDPVVFDRDAAADVFPLLPASTNSIALFPLLQADRVRGFVLAGLPTVVGPSPEQLELGRALAGLAATAMERAELYESLRTHLQHMEVLYGLSDAVASTSDLSGALRHLNELLGRELGIELESISVANERLRGVLEADAPSGVEVEAIQSWRAKLAGSGGRLRPRTAGSAILVPIAQRGRVQGVLRVRPAGRPLDPSAEELLHAIGTACAEVIHKAGLRRDLAESEHRLTIAAERERIAQDLHDSVGQLITGLGMTLSSVAAEAPDDEWKRRLEDLAELTTDGSRQMREAIHSLLFFQVRRSGLVRSLRELGQTFEATSGITTSFQVRGRPVPIEPAKEDAIFRVAHEAFTNVRRHSGASAVSMSLTYETDEVVLAVRDQGAGFGQRDPFDQQGHFGLLGIRQRLEEAGGELLVANAHPHGVLIEARIRLRRRRALATNSGSRH